MDLRIATLCCFFQTVHSQVIQIGTQVSSSGDTTYTSEQTVGLWQNSDGEIVWAGFTTGHFAGALNWLGKNDPVVAKFDAALTRYTWGAGSTSVTRQEHSDEHDTPTGGVVTTSDDIIVVGETLGPLFGSHLGGFDAWIIKYTNAGDTVFSQQWGTSEADGARSVAVASSGNIYVSGYTNDAFPGESSAGGLDMFLRKFQSDGTEVFTKQYGSAGHEYGNGIQVNTSDGVEEVFVAGTTNGDFGGTNPVDTGYGNTDIILVKFDSSGGLTWQIRHLGDGTETFTQMQLVFDEIYICGVTNGDLDGESNRNTESYLGADFQTFL